MKLKKYCIYLITLVISLIAVCNFSLGIYAKKYVKYEIDVNKDVRVSRVMINGTEMPKERYISDDVYIDSDKNLTSEKESKIIIVASKVDDIIINFNTEDYTDINVLKDRNKTRYAWFIVHEL